jgi:hypothetical protein
MTDQTDLHLPSLYDYSQFNTETAASLQARASRTRSLLKRTSDDIIEIGKLLLEAKAQLPHGQYLPWIRAELGISQSTAWRFTQAAQGKPLKIFKANDLLAQKNPEREQEGPPSAKNGRAIIEILRPFLQELREQRTEFRQLEEQRASRITWLLEQQQALEEDDILALLEEELFTFAGIRQEDLQQASGLASWLREEPGPFALEDETERLTKLVDQMRTARGGLFGLSIEMGLRLSRVERLFAEEKEHEERLIVKEEALKRYQKKFVQEALEIGSKLLALDNLLPKEHFTALVRSEFGLQPAQVQTLCDAARRYPASSEPVDMPADLARQLAELYYELSLAQQDS